MKKLDDEHVVLTNIELLLYSRIAMLMGKYISQEIHPEMTEDEIVNMFTFRIVGEVKSLGAEKEQQLITSMIKEIEKKDKSNNNMAVWIKAMPA